MMTQRPAGSRAFGAALTIGLVFLSMIGGCVHTAQFTDPRGRVIPESISSMDDVIVGGITQRIWFRGLNRSNPALVLLHGGPGISEAALFRHYNAELERHFLVVYWEQRGAGRSFHADIPATSMTIAQLLRDLDEVVDLVRRRFAKGNVVLLGHSWGSVLGTIYAHEHPDKVAAYIGVAQIANFAEGEQLSYEWALSQAIARNNDRAIGELRAMSPRPRSVDNELTKGKWVEAFGGMFHRDLSTLKLILAALSTDEASLLDLVKFGKGNRFSLECLRPQYSRVDLTRYQSFDVPVFLFLGRYDWQIPSVLAAQYFKRIEAPCKRLVWFERSAHNPPFEEPEYFVRVMADEVAPLLAHQSQACSAR